MSIAKTFDPLLDLLDTVVSLDINDLFEQVAETKEFKDLVIFLNQEGQLELGVNSKGERLEKVRNDKRGLLYSPSYELLRKKRGLPVDRITLNFTGSFGRSFEVNIDRNKDEVLISINANTIKENTDLRKVWGNEILGLSDESIEVLVDFAREAIQINLQRLLFSR